MAKAKKKTSVRTSGARASGARTSARPKSAVKPRAIGELMCSWETISDTGLRIPQVMGYAAFAKKYRTSR